MHHSNHRSDHADSRGLCKNENQNHWRSGTSLGESLWSHRRTSPLESTGSSRTVLPPDVWWGCYIRTRWYSNTAWCRRRRNRTLLYSKRSRIKVCELQKRRQICILISRCPCLLHQWAQRPALSLHHQTVRLTSRMFQFRRLQRRRTAGCLPVKDSDRRALSHHRNHPTSAHRQHIRFRLSRTRAPARSSNRSSCFLPCLWCDFIRSDSWFDFVDSSAMGEPVS